MSCYAAKTKKRSALNETKIKDVFEGFKQTTTLHGIPHIANSKGLIKCAVWTLFSLGCFSGFMYNMILLTTTYLSFDVDTKTQVVSSRELVFPAISVCNYNPVKNSLLSLSPKLQTIFGGGAQVAKQRRKRATPSFCTSDYRPENRHCFCYPATPSFCTSDYRPENRHCFCYPGSSSFEAGDRTCTNYGGHLVVINTEEKSNLVFSIVTISADTWIGLKRSVSWNWIDGTPFTWINWHSSASIHTDSYAYVRTDGTWGTDVAAGSDSLNTKRPLCEFDMKCSSQYVYGTTASVYCFNSRTDMYEDASTHCSASGGRLAIIDDQQKLKFIISELAISNNAWIGLKRTTEKSWSWADGSVLSGDNWDTTADVLTYEYAYVKPSDQKLATDDQRSGNSVSRMGCICELFSDVTITQPHTTMVTTLQATTTEPITTEPTTLQPPSTEPTTLQLTTTEPTTLQQTSTYSTISQPTSTKPTTLQPTTTEPTTLQQTSTEPTTLQQTTIEPTTLQQTTTEPNTLQPTTTEPTTLLPTTTEPTTLQPTTTEPTTLQPTSTEPTTLQQTTIEPTTSQQTTTEPTTLQPTTTEPTTLLPTTTEPITLQPTTTEPTTLQPTSTEPNTLQPSTTEPTTLQPTTIEPTTLLLTTTEPTTLQPPTTEPTTLQPTTLKLTTIEPTSLQPTTLEPTTLQSTTTEQTTLKPATTKLTTSQQTTSQPTTKDSTTLQPTTTEQTTAEQTTTEQTTLQTNTIESTTKEASTIQLTSQQTTTEATTLEPLATESTRIMEISNKTSTIETTVNEASTTESTTATTISSTSTSVFPERIPYREDFLVENDVISTLADTPIEIKKQMGYKLTEFMIDCKYQGRPCDTSKFGYFYDSAHGNCYVFNGGWGENSSNIFYTAKTGSQHGVSFMFNLVQPEYMTKGISSAAGSLIVVHRQEVMPFPGDQAILAPPGKLTSVGIRQIYTERLGGVYNDCRTFTKNNLSINVFAEHFPVNYSVHACEITCYQHYVIQECGCADPQYPIQGQAFGSGVPDICDARNQTQDDCVYNMTLRYNTDVLDCDCPNPCMETAYTHSISYSIWPTERGLRDIHRQYGEYIDYLKVMSNNATTEEEIIKSNFLRVYIFMEDLNYQSIIQKAKYPFVKYISDLAAIAGLWLGCSLLTIVEVVEVVMDLLVLLLLKPYQLLKSLSCRNKIATNNRISKKRGTSCDATETRPNKTISPRNVKLEMKQAKKRKVTNGDDEKITEKKPSKVFHRQLHRREIGYM